jgi:hypothetical protein
MGTGGSVLLESCVTFTDSLISICCAAQNELVGSVAQKTRFLENLRSELAAIQAAAAPARTALALNGAAAKLPAEAQALSLPLYLIYSQLSAAAVRRACLSGFGRVSGSRRGSLGSGFKVRVEVALLLQR